MHNMHQARQMSKQTGFLIQVQEDNSELEADLLQAVPTNILKNSLEDETLSLLSRD